MLNKRHTGRDHYLDFFRGLIILDMVLVHFSSKFPFWIRKLIISFDFAMEGFLIVAGFIIGKHYLPKFISSKKRVIRRMLFRSLQVGCIYYLMVFTIVVPYFSMFKAETGGELRQVLIRSFLFLNQIGIVHILPTFIPLFIVSPLILLILSRNYDNLVLLISILIFFVGCKEPYLFNIGDRTIFPVILWQIYFCLGCYLGKRLDNKPIDSHATRRIVFLAFAMFFVVFSITHCGFFFPEVNVLKERYGIFLFKRFPLNLWGLINGVSLLFILYSVTAYLWPMLRHSRIINHPISVFGRHSLLIFALHSYFVYITNAVYSVSNSLTAAYFCIVTSLIVMYKISCARDIGDIARASCDRRGAVG